MVMPSALTVLRSTETGDAWLLDPGDRLAARLARDGQYVSAALITDAGADREGWRLAAREIEEAVIKILADALTSPAGLVERFGAAGMPSDQIRKLLSRAARVKAALGGSPGERAKLVHELVEKIIVDEKTIIIQLRRSFLLGIPSSASEAASEGAVELTAAVAFTRRGAETKLVLPGLAPQTHSSRCDPALIKAIARGRAWFEELATGRAREGRSAPLFWQRLVNAGNPGCRGGPPGARTPPAAGARHFCPNSTWSAGRRLYGSRHHLTKAQPLVGQSVLLAKEIRWPVCYCHSCRGWCRRATA
jgi:hypothetical protein